MGSTVNHEGENFLPLFGEKQTAYGGLNNLGHKDPDTLPSYESTEQAKEIIIELIDGTPSVVKWKTPESNRPITPGSEAMEKVSGETSVDLTELEAYQAIHDQGGGNGEAIIANNILLGVQRMFEDVSGDVIAEKERRITVANDMALVAMHDMKRIEESIDPF